MASRLITMRAGESIFIDFQKKDGAVIDTEMNASYSLLNDQDVEEFNGVCAKSGDLYTFEMRVSGATTTGLTDGVYTLLVKVYDDTSGYADYVYEENIKVRS